MQHLTRPKLAALDLIINCCDISVSERWKACLELHRRYLGQFPQSYCPPMLGPHLLSAQRTDARPIFSRLVRGGYLGAIWHQTNWWIYIAQLTLLDCTTGCLIYTWGTLSYLPMSPFMLHILTFVETEKTFIALQQCNSNALVSTSFEEKRRFASS